MPRNIVKILEKNFSDMKAGEKMLISSPEVISNYISKIQKNYHSQRDETRACKRKRC